MRFLSRADEFLARRNFRASPTSLQGEMDSLSGYSHRPFAFVLRYLRQRLASHIVIVVAVTLIDLLSQAMRTRLL